MFFLKLKIKIFNFIKLAKKNPSHFEELNPNCRLIIGVFIFMSSITILVLLFNKSSFQNLIDSFNLDSSLLIFGSINKNETYILIICTVIISASIIFLYNSFKKLKENKNYILALSVIQKIITDLIYKKCFEKQEDPEIDVDEYTKLLAKEINMEENYIRENIISKISFYFEEKQESNVIQLNFYLDGRIRSFWKLKQL